MNLMFVAIGSTTARRIFGAIRLLHIETWTSVLANASGSNATQVEFFSSLGSDDFDQGPPETFEAISSGNSKPGYISIRPGVLTKLGRWMTTAASVPALAFTSSGQPGDIVDVTVEFTFLDVDATAPLGLSTSGATAGIIYTNSYLDNTSTSSTSGTQILASTSGFNPGVGVG
jgi:hypothetical protein